MKRAPGPIGRAWRACAIVLGLSLLAACSAVDGESQDSSSSREKLPFSFEEILATKLAKAPSAFVREVLLRAQERGSIAPEDYEEAHNRYANCTKVRGLGETYTKLPNGLYEIKPNISGGQKEVDAYFDAANACGEEYLADIESLFTLQIANPDMLADNRQVAINCLRGIDVVDAGYGVDDLSRDMKSALEGTRIDPSDPRTRACLHGAGFAITQGR